MVGTPPTIFSVIEKLVAEATKTGAASRKFVPVPQNVILIRKTILFAVKTAVRKTKNTVSRTFTTVASLEKMSFGSGNIFMALKPMVFASPTMVKIDRCRMSYFIN